MAREHETYQRFLIQSKNNSTKGLEVQNWRLCEEICCRMRARSPKGARLSLIFSKKKSRVWESVPFVYFLFEQPTPTLF